jgi:hypothetical protein
MRSKPLPPDVVRLLSTTDPQTRSRIEPVLVRAINACGCKSGAVGLVASVAVSVVWWLAERDGRVVMWPEAGIAFAAVVAATVIAKGAGILAGRLRYAVAVRQLRRRIITTVGTST